MPLFDRYLGIDYSGAQTPASSLPGLRVYEATLKQAPTEIHPPPSPRKYWTRRGLAEWLAAELRDGPPTLVGMDHAFSFPTRYFEVHHLAPDWSAFLDDFCHHWPTDEDTRKMTQPPNPWLITVVKTPGCSKRSAVCLYGRHHPGKEKPRIR